VSSLGLSSAFFIHMPLQICHHRRLREAGNPGLTKSNLGGYYKGTVLEVHGRPRLVENL
jgi:hypothetical protein